MSNWTVKSVDFMKISQDSVRNPISLELKRKGVGRAKELGCTHAAISTPYDTPHGAPDSNEQSKEWVDVIRQNGMKVWHRHSWLSDEGWYDTQHNNGDDRIADTVAWIKAHKDLFQNGDIFTPKPEPQNMRVIGINWDDANTARFKNPQQFNEWLRNMSKACRAALDELGLQGVKVGYWGFDGFVVCGYNNSDWQGKSFLEKSTVDQMEDGISVDHYPPPGTTMADFIRVFKQVWAGKKLIIGEYGAKGLDSEGVKAQIIEVFNTLEKDPIVTGINYWPMVGGLDGQLLNNEYDPAPWFDVVRVYYTSGAVPTPTPIPTPTPPPVPPTTPPVPVPPVLGEQFIEIEGVNPMIGLTNKGNLWRRANNVWTRIGLPTFS